MRTHLNGLLIVTVSIIASAAFAQEAPTFSGEVATIVYNQCTPCHRANGGGPFPLVTYEDVQKRAKMIVKVVESGYMPPWKMEHSDLKFKNERRMSEEEVTLLAAWVGGGMPVGDVNAIPPAPAFPSEWVHGVPDMVLEMEEDMPVPESGTDIYRSFVVRIPDLPPGKYLKGLEYKPRAITTAHHTLFSIDSTGTARKRSEADPGPGLRGGGGGGGAMGRIAGWAVGSVPALFPEGAAFEVPPGSDLVLSSHFHPTGKAEVERSQIALYLTDEAPVRYLNTVDLPFMFGALKDIRIPAGEANYVVKEQFTIPVDSTIASIAPHAHYLAKTMQMQATLPDARVIDMVNIRDWDFAWQEQYELEEELALPKGTRIDMEFVYDNSAANPRNPTSPPKEVLWGLQSTDEMASMTLGLITPTKEAQKEFRNSYVAWVKDGIEKADPQIAIASFATVNKDRLDLDGDGDISWRETGSFLAQMYGRIRSSSSAGGDANETRAQIMPVVFKRVFTALVLPWLLPRLAVGLLLIAGLIYLLRRWRRGRRKLRDDDMSNREPVTDSA